MTVLADKTDVRAALLGRRADVSASIRIALAHRLAEIGPALSRQHMGERHGIVSAFLPIRGEADTMPLIMALHDAGCETALPVTPARGELLRFHLWRPGDALAAGAWRIPEPLPGAPEADPDVLFVPLAAFDRSGQRLGYGVRLLRQCLGAAAPAKIRAGDRRRLRAPGGRGRSGGAA